MEPEGLTNFVEHSLSANANSRLASQEIACILCRLKVHYRVNNSLPLFPILRQMYTVHNFTLRSLLILPFHLWLGLPSGLLPSSFPTIFYKHFSSVPCVSLNIQ